MSAVYSIDRLQATLLIPLQQGQTDLSALLAGHLAASVHVDQMDKPCLAAVPRPLSAPPQSLRIALRFRCDAPVKSSGWRLTDNAFFDLASTHIHIARLAHDSREREFVFTDTHRRRVLRSAAGGTKTKTTPAGFLVGLALYVRLGISHILHGFDHLAFVTALLLLAGISDRRFTATADRLTRSRRSPPGPRQVGSATPALPGGSCTRPRRHRDGLAWSPAEKYALTHGYRNVAMLITGFTVGHSITLSLAALGIIEPDSGAIEALIGFSIAFVAMELLLTPGSRCWQRTTLFTSVLFVFLSIAANFGLGALSPLTWAGLAVFVYCYGQLVTTAQLGLRASLALTVAFGLVHGAGFAGVLSQAGLPASRHLAALAGFNIGVEIGQFAVVASWLIVFASWTRLAGTAQRRSAYALLSAIILLLGVYWFIGRAVA